MRSVIRSYGVGGILVVMLLFWGTSNWVSAQPQQSAHEIGAFAIGPIMEKIMNSDRYKPERDLMREESENKRIKVYDETMAMRAQVEAMDPRSPEYATAAKRYTEAAKQYEELRVSLQAAYTEFFLTQRRSVYEQVVDAARAVAQAKGLHYVFTTSSAEPVGRIDTKDHYGQAIQFVARQLIVFPESVDISADIEAELHL